MDSFELTTKELAAGIPVLFFKGYLAKDGGAKLQDAVEALLQAGKSKLVIDLTECQVISSPGIAALLDLLLIITDDFKGKCVLSGLDQSNIMFLKMTGVIPLAGTAPTPEAATTALSG